MTTDKISPRQFQRMMMIELFSTASLILPALIVRQNGKGGFVPLCLGSALALMLAAYYMWAGDFRGKSYSIQVVERNGKWLGGIYTLIYCGRYVLHGFFLMVLFSALLGETLLPGQSRAMILVPILLLTFYATRKTLAVRARILELLFYFIFVPMLIVVFLGLFQVDYGSLPRMLWGEDRGTLNNALGAYEVLMTYRAMEFILFLRPAVEGKKEGGFLPIWSCLMAAAFHMAIYLVTVGMFGTERTGGKLWSALYIMQSVRLPGHFLERLDILFLAFWIFSIFALFSGYLFYSELLVRQWLGSFRGRGGRKLFYPVLFLLVVLFLVLVFPEPEKALGFLGKYFLWVDFPLALALPLLIRMEKPIPGGRGKKTGAALLAFLALGGLLSGCGSRVDLEDRNYILALGIDAGKERNFLVTYGTADLEEPTGQGEGGASQEGKASSYEADSLSEAEEEDGRSDERRLDYGHLKALIISEKVAEDPWLWEKLMKELDKKQNLSGAVFVFLTEEAAKNCIKDEKELGTSLGDYLEKMITNHKKDGTREYTLQQLLRDEAEGMEGNIPVLKGTGKKMSLE